MKFSVQPHNQSHFTKRNLQNQSLHQRADAKPITSEENFLTMVTDETDAALNHQRNGFT